MTTPPIQINVRMGVDIDPACEYPYMKNNKAKFLLKSVGDIESDELASYYLPRSVRLLAGCAPCQTFSSYNQKASTDDVVVASLLAPCRRTAS